MENFTPFFPPPDYCINNQMQKLYKTLDKSLILVKNAIQSEMKDEFFYGYLISAAPTQEERNIIAAIREDELKHNKYLREIFNYYTKQKITTPAAVNFEKPKSYIQGITSAKFSKLTAVEKYRDIRAGLPTEYYRDMVFEILVDELKHADKYGYILYLNLKNTTFSSVTSEPLMPSEKKTFTSEEAKAIATVLGIDFSSEKFDLEQFRMGLDVELEHGKKYSSTNITNDDPILTGKITFAHLIEFPDYYNRLIKLEEEAKAYWCDKNDIYRQVKEFTLRELAQYNGSMGKPAYVAVNGTVYDVSNIPAWGGGTHFSLQAGNDLTDEFQNCHSMEILQKLPKVGTLKA